MKIAIVGNADIHTKHGEFIDSHDMVIRFNHCRTKGYEDIVGTKTTALGVALGTDAGSNHLERIDKDILRQCNIVIFGKPKRNTMYEERIKTIAQKSMLFDYITNECYNHLVDLVGQNPSTGISVIYNIIKTVHNNEINIFNFDNFKTVHYFETAKREKKVLYHPIDKEKEVMEIWRSRGLLNVYS